MIQVYWEAKPRFKKIAGWLKSTGRVEIEASPNHPLDIAEVQAGIERRLALKRPTLPVQRLSAELMEKWSQSTPTT